MIVFNECRVSDDGKCLIVEAEVSTLSYFTNCYITDVYVDTDKTYSMNGTTKDSVHIDLENERHTVLKSEGNIKSVRLFINAKDLNLGSLDKHIFFIRVHAGGYPEPGSPCGMDEEWHLCYAWNPRPIYNAIMSNIRELGNTCSIPKNFIDLFLKLNAVKMALKSGHFNDAKSLWQSWELGAVNSTVTRRKCGCNGYNQ